MIDIDKLMRSIGFLDTDTGPNVTRLRQLYKDSRTLQVNIFWGNKKLTAEEREDVAELLLLCYDSPSQKVYNVDSDDPQVRYTPPVDNPPMTGCEKQTIDEFLGFSPTYICHRTRCLGQCPSKCPSKCP